MCECMLLASTSLNFTHPWAVSWETSKTTHTGTNQTPENIKEWVNWEIMKSTAGSTSDRLTSKKYLRGTGTLKNFRSPTGRLLWYSEPVAWSLLVSALGFPIHTHIKSNPQAVQAPPSLETQELKPSPEAWLLPSLFLKEGRKLYTERKIERKGKPGSLTWKPVIVKVWKERVKLPVGKGERERTHYTGDRPTTTSVLTWAIDRGVPQESSHRRGEKLQRWIPLLKSTHCLKCSDAHTAHAFSDN